MTRKTLRTGFTTGTAAAAAAKGALLSLLREKPPHCVEIMLLTGEPIRIPVRRCVKEAANMAACVVVKDAGDDPDVTHGAEIGARVILVSETVGSPVVNISGGRGVGMVTKPGLEVPPGEAAINPGPRKMISRSIRSVLHDLEISKSVSVEIFVPDGEALAKKTLNDRLGIKGGISILGTTGIVRPLSHEAYTATIESALSVAAAMHHDQVVFTTGRRSERFAQACWPQLPEESFVQMGDFFEMSLRAASQKKMKRIILAAFFGKAVKMAQGHGCTHAAKSKLTLHRLAEWARIEAADPALADRILSAHTARHAFDFIHGKYPDLIAFVGREIIRSARSYSDPEVALRSVIFDYEGKVAFDSEKNKP